MHSLQQENVKLGKACLNGTGFLRSLDERNGSQLRLKIGIIFGGAVASARATSPAHPSPQQCIGCDKPLGDYWIQNSVGGDWHPPCFLCTGCKKPITEGQFQVQGRDPYHKPCYQKKFDPLCEVCHEYIPINESSGMIQWRFHPYWGTKYCPAHEMDLTARCVSCERMQPRDQRYIDLDGGRKLCPQCFDSAVFDVKDSQSVYDNVKDFYARLGLKIEQEIPLLLVDTKALKAAAEKDGHHRFEPKARGMCLSEERIIETFNKRSLAAAREGHSGATRHDIPRQLTQTRVVTSILVLSGFPRLLTGSIVAHEMMHAWLKLQGPFPYVNLTQKHLVEED
ncbi:unnamed protein product [Calypogeia fissa]